MKPSGQSLWIYLITGRFRTSIPGLNLNIGIGALSDRLKWRIVDVERCWTEIEAQGMAEADWRAGVVWLPKGIEHNEPESPNVIKGWGRVVLPECDLMTRALQALRDYIGANLTEAYQKAFQEAFKQRLRKDLGDTFREGSRNQEQEQDQVLPPNPPPGGVRRPRLRDLKKSDPFDQRGKTAEMQRLMREEGLTQAEAHSRVFS